MSTISASTTSTTAYKVTADTTGTLVFQTGASPTTAMTLGSDQSVTFAGAQTYSSGVALNLKNPSNNTTFSISNNGGSGVSNLNFSNGSWSPVQFSGSAVILQGSSTGSVYPIIRRSNVNGSNGIQIQANAADLVDDTNPGANIQLYGGSLTDGFEGNINIRAYGADSSNTRNKINFYNRSGTNASQLNLTVSNYGIGLGATYNASSGIGIRFPASQSASTDANTLDDYEEGTYTTVFYSAASGGGSVIASTTGTYVKVGAVVTVSFNRGASGAGTCSSFSLPFTCYVPMSGTTADSTFLYNDGGNFVNYRTAEPTYSRGNVTYITTF